MINFQSPILVYPKLVYLKFQQKQLKILSSFHFPPLQPSLFRLPCHIFNRQLTYSAQDNAATNKNMTVETHAAFVTVMPAHVYFLHARKCFKIHLHYRRACTIARLYTYLHIRFASTAFHLNSSLACF